MPEFDDERVGALLHTVGDAVSAHLRPPGAQAVFATVRRRRRNRTITTGALAIALIAGPLVGYGLANDRSPHVPTPAASASVTVSVPPSVAPSAPVPTVSASEAGPGGQSGPLTTRDIRNATLPIKTGPDTDLPCLPNSVTLVDGKTRPGVTPRVELVGEAVQLDADSDGDLETVVLLRCNPEHPYFVVVAFARTQAGKIDNLDIVVGGGPPYSSSGNIMHIFGIKADGKQIAVDAGDKELCCGVSADDMVRKTLKYTWDGRDFTETTSGLPSTPRTDVRVFAPAKLKLAKQQDGTWRGDPYVTVENAGDVVAYSGMLGVKVSGGLAGASLQWVDTPRECPREPELVAGKPYGPCQLVGILDPGEQVSGGLIIRSPKAISGTVEITVRNVRKGRVVSDSHPDNNVFIVQVTSD